MRSAFVRKISIHRAENLLTTQSFILGLSWGGSVYPWKDAHVIATLIVGFLCLVALFVYEAYVPLKEPLIPIHLFKNRGWVAAVISLSLGASTYYSQAIVWPQMTSTVYAHGRLIRQDRSAPLLGSSLRRKKLLVVLWSRRLGRLNGKVWLL